MLGYNSQFLDCPQSQQFSRHNRAHEYVVFVVVVVFDIVICNTARMEDNTTGIRTTI